MSSTFKNLNEFVDDRERVIRECVEAIEHIVQRQSGAYGFAVKAAYSMTRGLAPNMVHGLVDGLLEQFLDALTPFYHEALRLDVPIEKYIPAQKQRVAAALLDVTDTREKTERPSVLKSGYRKLRPSALTRIEDAAPELGDMLSRNIPVEHRPGLLGAGRELSYSAAY